jgi:hypothetical protein
MVAGGEDGGGCDGDDGVGRGGTDPVSMIRDRAWSKWAWVMR